MKPREDGMTQSVYEIMVDSFMKVYGITKEEAEKKITNITKGDKIGSTEAALLDKLKIYPFEYKMEVKKIL
jgi:hypothetical protein